MAAWTCISCDVLQKSFLSSGIYPFKKENLALERLITDAEVARTIDTGGRRLTSILNCKEATSPEILDSLQPYYAAAVNHGFYGPPFKLDFAYLNSADIINEWRTGDSQSGKVFSHVPAIFVNGLNITRH